MTERAPSRARKWLRPKAETMLDASTGRLIRLALEEDLGRAGDLTTRFFAPRGARVDGRIVARAAGVVCGLEVAREVFRAVSPRIRFIALTRDGRRVRAGQTLARVRGPASVLTAERTALNFLQRLSGVATLTRAFVDAARGTDAAVLDTRKTLPGWRSLDKYAVRCGGGANHRMGLYDMAMLKDNHWSALGPRGLARRVSAFRRRRPGVRVLIEAAGPAQVAGAIDAGADIILLDNMRPAALRREIRRIRRLSPRTLIEVSGGVGLGGIRRLARLGPDRISVGRITHSAPALDMSLET